MGTKKMRTRRMRFETCRVERDPQVASRPRNPIKLRLRRRWRRGGEGEVGRGGARPDPPMTKATDGPVAVAVAVVVAVVAIAVVETTITITMAIEG